MSNPYNNEVIFNGRTLMSLTEDTITPNKVLAGETFHDRSGAPQTGSLITHDVYDGLDSTSTSDALSANQGRVLNENYNTLNSNININSLFTKGPNEDGGPTGRRCGKLVLFNFIGERRTHTEGEVIFTVASEIRPVSDLKFLGSINGVSVILNLSASTGECTIFLINGQGNVNSRLYCTFTYICA